MEVGEILTITLDVTRISSINPPDSIQFLAVGFANNELILLNNAAVATISPIPIG